MTALFDSSAWLEYFFGSERGTTIKTLLENKEPIIVSKINIFEIYHKLLKELGKEVAERFTSFILLSASVDDLDVDTLRLAAEEKKTLRLSMADAIILATAIKYNATIYTTDSDFTAAKPIIPLVFL